MKVAGGGSRSARCVNCLTLIAPSDQRGLFCVKCIGRLGHGRKKKPVPKKKFKNFRTIPDQPSTQIHPLPTPTNTRPLSDYVDITDVNIDSSFDAPIINTPTTITGLREMRKNALIDLAIDLGIDPSGTKEILVKKLAEEIGIV